MLRIRPGGPGRGTDDTGSLVLALMLTLVGIMLTAILVPVVLTQVRSTRAYIQRSHALHAAQSGLDVALGRIRAANNGDGTGKLAGLPCGPIAGTVGDGGVARYEVTIDYVATDPRGQTDEWVAANHILCLPGGGTFPTPRYALLRSLGTDVPTGAIGTVARRSLRGTYRFRTTNENIAGGPIHVYKTTTTDLCMDAGSASPTATTALRLQVCVPGSLSQRLAYQDNLTLVLVSSKTVTNPLGMCLDAGTPHSVGAVVRFQPCAAVLKPQQQWSINDSANFMGTTDGDTLDDYCFNAQTPGSAGSFVILSRTTCDQAYNNVATFNPEATVGAGAAGASSNQLVNYQQFGRCLDVTEHQVSYGYLIAWPCKQAPDPTNVSWNQKWLLPAILPGAPSSVGRITTNPSSTLYCLRSPGSIAANKYVEVIVCPTGPLPLNMTWTVYGNTGDYATSYRIRDSYGFCLAPSGPADLYPKGLLVSKIVVATCGSTTAQKWNAPADLKESLPLQDIGER